MAGRDVTSEARIATWAEREPDLFLGRRRDDRGRHGAERRVADRRRGERRNGDRRRSAGPQAPTVDT